MVKTLQVWITWITWRISSCWAKDTMQTQYFDQSLKDGTTEHGIITTNRNQNNVLVSFLWYVIKTLFFGVVTWSSKQICNILNIWLKLKIQEIKQLNWSFHVVPFCLVFPAANVPWVRGGWRRTATPAASAITSDVAQPRESFQAGSSQTAEAWLKRHRLPSAPSLGTLSSMRAQSVIKYWTCNTRVQQKKSIFSSVSSYEQKEM